MTRFPVSLVRGSVAALAAGAMALGSAVPAQAQWRDRDRDYDDRRNDRIDVGDIIAGALVIGGIAAVASAAGRDRYDRGDRYDRRGGYDRDGRYDRGYSPREAVEQCVYAAERTAGRYSHGGRSQVTDIRGVDRRRDGYKVSGRIAVNQMGRDWRRGDDRYGRGWDDDYRGWDNRHAGYDSGRFTCDVRYGRVVDLDFKGIRGLG